MINEFKNSKMFQEDDSDSENDDQMERKPLKCDITHVQIMEMLDKIQTSALQHGDRYLLALKK